MRNLSGLGKFALILVIIGALNWGLIGLFGFNLVEGLFGGFNWFTRLVYILVGLSGVWLAVEAAGASSRHRPTQAGMPT